MSVVASELKIYGSASIAETDVGTQGGAIDTTVRYVFDSTVAALNDTVNVVSDSAADNTQTVTVTGRLASGIITSEAFVLTGVTPVEGAVVFERILKIVISGAHTGTINVVDDDTSTTILDMESGVLQVRRPFYNCSSDVLGGSVRLIYEKLFIKNTNATLALLSAVVSESADPSTLITFTLESTVGGSESVASRLNTAPTSISEAFSNTAKNVPGTNLAAGSAVGCWILLSLPAGQAASDTTYTLGIAGSTV